MRQGIETQRFGLVASAMSAAGLILGACASDEPVLPPGAQLPAEYRFQVVFGEEWSESVLVYSDTEPVVSVQDSKTIVSIDGHTFCPPDEVQYGDEPVQSWKRDNYCSGDGVYAEYSAVVDSGRVAVIDRGGE